MFDPQPIRRPLKDVDFGGYVEEILYYEEHGVLPIGRLDALRGQIWPDLAERTSLTLMLIVREVYREITFRSFESMKLDGGLL